jgi:DNA-binding MarR family transcriptional regulator
MFFLKELPSRQMVDGYADLHGVDATIVEDALSLMRQASLLIRRLEAYFAEHDLSQLRFLILIVIDREPDRQSLTIGEITGRLDVAGPVVTRTLKMLSEDALIAIEPDTKDRRTRHVSLTSDGREKLAAVLPGYFRILAERAST